MTFLFNLAIVVALLCGVTSCAKSEIEIPHQKVVVDFSAHFVDIESRAQTYGKGERVNILFYNIYDSENNLLLEGLSGRTARLTDGSFKFSVEMLKGMEYDIVLWAQDSTSTAYSLNGNTVTVNYRNADDTDAAEANDDSRDAFCKFVEDFDPTSATAVKNFALTRPFAQLNAAALNEDIAAAASNGITMTTSTISSKCFTTLNIATGAVTGLTETAVEFTATEVPYKNGEELTSGYKYLSMNYLLVPDNGYTTDVTFTFNTNRSDVTLGNTYYSIPLKPNFRTNILGSILSKSTQFNVSIDHLWAGDGLDQNSSLY